MAIFSSFLPGRFPLCGRVGELPQQIRQRRSQRLLGGGGQFHTIGPDWQYPQWLLLELIS